MGDVGPLYAKGRERIAGLVHDLDPERAATSVPPCPGWTVHDVVAHLSGICADIVGGRFEMLRALTGRRSEEQIAAFDWDADYRPYLGAFSRGPFRMAQVPVAE